MNRHAAQYLLTSVLVTGGLSACGGGGNSAPAEKPVGTVAVSISPMKQVVLYTGRAVSFSAVGKSSIDLPLTYQWDFGDGTTGSGASLNHTYAKSGTYSIKITATDSNGVKASSSGVLSVVNAVLTTPTITANPATGFAGVDVSFKGASSDPGGGTLTYNWDFGDQGKASGDTVTHSFSTQGTYAVVLTVTNDLGTTVKNTLSYVVNAYTGAPTVPVISAPTVTGTAKPVTLTASALDALPLTYSWDFGDNTTGSGASVQHSYSNAGNYQVTVTATNTKGAKTVSAPLSVSVLQQVSNALTAACGGSNCSATGATTYSGSGVGVWQYQNASTTPVLMDFSISGVKAGQVATVLFTNPSETTTLAAPGFGNIPAATKPLQPGNLNMQALHYQMQKDLQHNYMLQKNRDLARYFRQHPEMLKANKSIYGLPPVRPVAIGDSRVWTDDYDSSNPVNYTLKATQMCALKSGRKAVFWSDPNGGAGPADIAELANTFCANGGLGKAGFDALTDIMGDAWGNAAKSGMISDSQGLQDIHIVLPKVPASTGWGGYFWSANNYTKAIYKNSNEALVFFINGSQVSQSMDYYKSTLIHEAVHMINYYQRSVARSIDHDTWLEETSAMMGEDILSKRISGGAFNKVADVRLPEFIQTGGGVSYINWPNLSGKNYAMGGSFGAFLNRKYGQSLFGKIETDCKDGGTQTSYQCLDALIKATGGNGIGDDLARMGISVFGNTPGSALPAGFGFPMRTVDGDFAAIDVAALSKVVTVSPVIPLLFMPTSHYFRQEVLASAGSYNKSGMLVPAGATMHLMIRDAAP
jgi:PKD repeat protein